MSVWECKYELNNLLSVLSDELPNLPNKTVTTKNDIRFLSVSTQAK